MEDCNFSETPFPSETPVSQSNFILLPSQDETQQESQNEQEMKKILKKLPALQGPASKAKQLLLGESSNLSTEEEPETGKILVADTEYVPHTELTEQSEFISESEDVRNSQVDVTVVQNKMTGKVLVFDTDYEAGNNTEHTTGPSDFVSETSDVSDDQAETTVIQRQVTDNVNDKDSRCSSPVEPDHTPTHKQGRSSSSSPSNESSFQSKNRSNLGSYDQCELYTSQKEHAKGYRFNLFPSSQEDMFGGSEAGHEDDVSHVATPAEHIGSLHLSLQPMLVPETVDEIDNAIPPSPGVYGSTSMMIPDSPTQDKSTEDGSEYDINAADTFAENSKGFGYKDSPDSVVDVDEEEDIPRGSHRQTSKTPPSLDIEAALLVPTLVDDGKSESLHLHLTESTPVDSAPTTNDVPEHKEIICIDIESDSVPKGDHKDKSRASCKNGTPGEEERVADDDEVIVIQSGSVSTQQEDDSQQLLLHLTPSQGLSTQGQRSQGMTTSGQQGRHMQSISQKITRSQRSNSETSQGPRSQGETMPSQMSKSGSPQGQRSQGESSQGHRSQGNGRSHKSRAEKKIRDMNDNPLVLWKDESDSEKKLLDAGVAKSSSSERFSAGFHLSVPKEGTLPQPEADKDHTTVEERKADDIGEERKVDDIGEERKADDIGEVERRDEKDEKTCIEEMDIHDNDDGALTIGMIQSESELVSQPLFRLERPDIQGTEVSQDVSEDLFTKSTNRQMRPHTRYILDDDSDDNGDSSTRDTAQHVGEDDIPTHTVDVQPKSCEDNPSTSRAQKQDVIPPQEGGFQQSGSIEKPTSSSVQSGSVEKNSKSSVQEYLKEDTTMQEETEEILIAQKLDLQQPLEESAETTQPYNPTMSKLIESSTQTQDKAVGDFENVDISVVQKVAEYLQSGYTPLSRSRSSSTCTDLSDIHNEGSEKGDGQSKPQTPQKKDGIEKWKSPLSRRESLDRKSPKEIKDIIKTYSDILAKKRSRHTSKCEDVRNDDKSLPSSQRPNPAADGQTPGGSNLIPRRLSTQSLPSDLNKSKIIVQSDVSTSKSKNTNQSEKEDPWMTARKPPSPLSVGSERSERNSGLTLGSPARKSQNLDNASGMTQEMSAAYSVSLNEQTAMPNVIPPSGMNKNEERVSTPQVQNIIPHQTKNGANPSTKKEILTPAKSATTGIENMIFSSPNGNQSKSVNNQSIVTLVETRSPVVVLSRLPEAGSAGKKLTDSRRHLRRRHAFGKKKAKKLMSSAERNQLRRTVDSVSPQIPSGSFVASTQKFRSTEGKGETVYMAGVGQGSKAGGSLDPFSFHGSQSQLLPEETVTPKHDPVASSSLDETPLSSRKRSRLQHKQSGLKKPRIETSKSQTVPPAKHHVSFKPITSPVPVSHDQQISQASDVTTTTTGSLPSIPSSISQSSPGIEVMLSPSSSSSRQSVGEQISTRLSGKRLSLEQSLPDTIPLQHSEEDNYQRVTIVTETVETLYREIKTVRKVIGSQGEILESLVDVKKMDPVVVEESTHKKVQFVYVPSPSRSVTSLTSGDLGDISSSLSRSSVSSFSRSSGSVGVGSKVGSVQSSLDRSYSNVRALETQTSLDQQEAVQAVNKGEGHSKTATPSRRDSESSGIKTDKPIIMAKAAVPKTPNVVDSSRMKPITPALSDQEASDVATPLGSTINKTGSYLHSRTTSVESPKVSESLFTSSGEKGAKESSSSGGRGKKKRQSPPPSGSIVKRQTSSSDEISPQIPNQDPNQDHVVSSSSPIAEKALVPSSGTPGSRVIAKWKDGFYYPGTLKSAADRYSRCAVKFDDGDSRSVKLCDILLIEKLPVGQSVMVLTKLGDFECGMVSRQQSEHYVVETDVGTSGRYTFSQVILTADQASCLISDAGSDILMMLPGQQGPHTNVGDVSLENLIDAPRRSTKKQPLLPEVKVESEGKGQAGQSTRGKKRKIDQLKPQATSTPTPKGKSESIVKKRRGEGLFEESPIGTAQGSPVSARRSPRKTRVGLFSNDIGPLPTQKLFKGMFFLLTHVEKTREQKDQELKLLQDSSLETSTDESAVEEELCAPFNKDHLKLQIEAGGGTVLDNLDEKLISKKKCLLLSSTFQRTIKYLQCLAGGIPCISHMWLIDSCSQGRVLDEKSYVLPAGISLEKRRLMEWKNSKDTFTGVKAVVHSSNTKFVETWTTIMRLAKCHVYKQVQYTDVHVIVTDSTCSATVERQARSHSVPLVSTEWVIQSLVNSRIVAYDGHPRYKHDFVI